ncbi:MAG: alpha/beta hydrolase [Candidatus Eisenbacteria bacterium]
MQARSPWHEWEPFVETWSKRYFCIAPTALGHGASPAVDRLSFPELGAAVISLLDELQVPRTHLVGSSMGGVTSLYLATTQPERIDRLVLYRCSYRTGPAVAASLTVMQDPETWKRWGLEDTLRSLHDPQGGPDAWRTVLRRVKELVATEPASFDLEAVRAVTAPTLVICGDRDPLVPLEDAVTLYRSIPASALWIVPGATHLISAETIRRPAFEQEILRFLSHPLP